MSRSTGDKLGPYELLVPIGKGGMGEVFRARDPRLNRDVAIKVSAERFTERFEREAHAIAALNHPNICHLYDVGPDYLVMELVEGPTLAEHLKSGAIPLEEALNIARQMADALETAHEKGITHRDLKPGNIKIKADGTVKVLDFGLAKMGGTPVAQSDHSPTLTMGQTEAGVILGTAAYMSPEQAKGKPVDQRADIYSFGVVLYEMVTGRQLHHGESTTEVLASVIKEEPKWEKVPPQVRKLLQRCLEKDPQKRLRHIGDVMALVDDAPGSARAAAAQAGSPRRGWLWPALASAIVVGLAAVGWNWWRSTRLTDLPLVRQDVNMGSDLALPGPVTFVSNVVISPDGTRVAFVARPAAGGPARLYTRRLDQPKAVELPGTESPRGPFFSPDGRWIGFASSRRLQKISVDGGATVPLLDLTGTFAGASWGENDIIVSQQGSVLLRIPAGGGQPIHVTEFATGEIIQVSPQILPGGNAVLFAGNTGNEGGPADPDRGSVEVVSLMDHQRKTLVKGGAFPRYVASANSTGHLLYTFRGALYAIPFDPSKLETKGTAVPVLDDVIGAQAIAGKFDVSLTGTLVYQKGSAGAGPAMTTIQWIDATGKQQPLLSRQGAYLTPKVSPEGKRIVLAVREGVNQDIEVYEWESDRTTRLTFGGGTYSNPIWRPDGQFIVFRSANGSLYWTRVDGSGQPQQLTQGKINAPQVSWSFSPDGKRLAFMQPEAGREQIWTVPVEQQDGQLKAGAPEQFLKSQFNDVQPAFSPDGKWIAYRSNESSQNEVYVRPFPSPASGQSGKWVISTQGGSFPVWSRTGHDMLYVGPGDQLMAVSYTVKGDTFVAEKPRVWLASVSNVNELDPAPDGKRVAAVVPIQAREAPKVEHEVVFLQNFFDDLRRRVPVR